jgi:hypothetical protein
MAVMFQFKVFWVVTPCGPVVGYQRLGSPYCLHLHGEVSENGGSCMHLRNVGILPQDYTAS